MRRSLALLAALLLAAPAAAGKGPPSKSQKSSQKSSAKDTHKGRGKSDRDRKKHREAERRPSVPDETAPRLAANPDDPREQRIRKLRERLEALVHETPLGRTRLGVAVLNARDGDVLYAHNADRLFDPASNTKILTTAAALTTLGGDYRYITRLVGAAPDEGGVIRGDVELRGSGDPSLSTQGLADLAREVAARGIIRIEGDLLADGKYRDPMRPEEKLGGGALILNRNTYTVRIRPTEPRKNAVASIEPLSPEFFAVECKATTVPKRKTRLKLSTSRTGDGRYLIVVKGRINPKSEVKLKEKLGDGAGYAAAVFRRALADYGVELTGGVKSGAVTRAGAASIAEHRSGPLADVCRISNKDSNNFVADQIFRTLGRECFGAGPVSDVMKKGARAVYEWLAPIGVPSSAWKIVNGSGLGHENRVDPLGLAQLLRHLYLDLRVAPEFVTSLAIGGVDGTIKGRFGGNMVGRVRAKTGTLSNVSALSGYVGDKGDVLVFAILVDDFHHRRLEEIRYAQARLVREMMGFLRADEAESQAAPEGEKPGEEPIEVDEDDQSEGEADTDGPAE